MIIPWHFCKGYTVVQNGNGNDYLGNHGLFMHSIFKLPKYVPCPKTLYFLVLVVLQNKMHSVIV